MDYEILPSDVRADLCLQINEEFYYNTDICILDTDITLQDISLVFSPVFDDGDEDQSEIGSCIIKSIIFAPFNLTN